MLFNFICINSIYKKIYDKAIENTKRKNFLEDTKDDYSAGIFEEGGWKIVFGMNLTSDSSRTILGHAIDGNTLAFVTSEKQRNYTNNYAFFEKKNTKIL